MLAACTRAVGQRASASGAAGSAQAVGIKLQCLVRQRYIGRHLAGLQKSLGLAARAHLAAHRAHLVGVREDHRGGLDQVIDHVGRFGGAGGEAIAHVHHGQLGVVVVAHHTLMIGQDAGVARQVGDQPVAEGQHIAGSRAGVTRDTGFFHGFAQLATDVVGVDAVAVQRGHGGNAHTARRHAAAEAGQHGIGRVAAIGPKLGGKEGRHLAAADDLGLLATAIATALVAGSAETERSGWAQVPALGALLCSFPTWSPCRWVTSTMSILPSRGSLAPATVRPGSYRIRVPFGSSNTRARSWGQNSPAMPPSGVTLTLSLAFWADAVPSPQLKARASAVLTSRDVLNMGCLLFCVSKYCMDGLFLLGCAPWYSG